MALTRRRTRRLVVAPGGSDAVEGDRASVRSEGSGDVAFTDLTGTAVDDRAATLDTETGGNGTSTDQNREDRTKSILLHRQKDEHPTDQIKPLESGPLSKALVNQERSKDGAAPPGIDVVAAKSTGEPSAAPNHKVRSSKRTTRAPARLPTTTAMEVRATKPAARRIPPQPRWTNNKKNSTDAIVLEETQKARKSKKRRTESENTSEIMNDAAKTDGKAGDYSPDEKLGNIVPEEESVTKLALQADKELLRPAVW